MAPRKPTTITAGLEKTLRVLRKSNRLSPEHEALISLARGLAAAVDEEPTVCSHCKGSSYNAALFKEYRAALATLLEVGVGNDLDDDTQQFLALIRTPPVRAAVVHPSDN